MPRTTVYRTGPPDRSEGCYLSVARTDRRALWRQQYRQRLQSVRSSALLLTLVDQLFHSPYLTFGRAKDVLQVTFRSATLNVRRLVEAGILEEIPGRKYGRIFVAKEIVSTLEATKPK